MRTVTIEITKCQDCNAESCGFRQLCGGIPANCPKLHTEYSKEHQARGYQEEPKPSPEPDKYDITITDRNWREASQTFCGVSFEKAIKVVEILSKKQEDE